ncbi:MAG: hypothetical protein ACR2RA_06100 [Geminicoccaceae bacterium]
MPRSVHDASRFALFHGCRSRPCSRLDSGGPARRQTIRILAVGVWTAILTLIIVNLVGAIVDLRVSKEVEIEGLDIAARGERGYELRAAARRGGSLPRSAGGVGVQGGWAGALGAASRRDGSCLNVSALPSPSSC